MQQEPLNINFKFPEFDNRKLKLAIPFLLLIAVSFLSIYTVEANENAVVLRFGKYSSTQTSGLHFKIPLIDTIYKVKVDYQFKREFGFRTLKPNVRTQYRNSGYEQESWILTGDLKIAEVKWVVQYKIKSAQDYLFNVKNVENTIADVAESAMQLMIGDRSFIEVLQQERVAIGDEARKYMQNLLDQYKSGIAIQLVQLQGVVPPKTVEDSFNEVNRAKQEQETLINEALQAYNKTVYKVEGDANRMITEAEGYSIERINTANGDADYYLSLYNEYKAYPEVTKTRMYIETMHHILSRNKNIIIVDKDIENLVPFLDQNKLNIK